MRVVVVVVVVVRGPLLVHLVDPVPGAPAAPAPHDELRLRLGVAQGHVDHTLITCTYKHSAMGASFIMYIYIFNLPYIYNIIYRQFVSVLSPV